MPTVRDGTILLTLATTNPYSLGCAEHKQFSKQFSVQSRNLVATTVPRGNSLPGGASPRVAGRGALETAHGAAPPHGPDVRYHVVAGAVLSRVRPRDLG